MFDDADVGDGVLAGLRGAAAAPAVAAVGDEVRFDAFVYRLASHEGEVMPADAVGPKLLAEMLSASARRRNTSPAVWS